MLFNKNKPTFKYFKSVYPKSKLDRNIYKIWRWLFIGKLSLYVSWIASRLNVSPNNITYLSFLIGLIGLYFFSIGGYYNFIIGSILINLWYLLDCSDGHLARYYQIKSNLGKFLDEAFGEIIMTFIWLSIGYGLFNNPDYSMILLSNHLKSLGSEYIILFGGIASISIALRNCISTRFSNCYSIDTTSSNIPNSPNKSILSIWFKLFWINFMGIGGLLGPLLILGSITGYLALLVCLYSIFYFSYMIISLIYFINKLKKSQI